jgi:hypothetical protein
MIDEDIETLKKQIKALQELVPVIRGNGTSGLPNGKLDDARLMALYSLVQEFAQRAGISSQEFQSRFELHQKRWYTHYLQEVQQTSPNLVAERDSGTNFNCDAAAHLPQLLDPPPGSSPHACQTHDQSNGFVASNKERALNLIFPVIFLTVCEFAIFKVSYFTFWCLMAFTGAISIFWIFRPWCKNQIKNPAASPTLRALHGPIPKK